MTILAAIIYGVIFVENLIEKRKAQHSASENARMIVRFVTNDLNKKLQFIDDTIAYKDYKPFFTDMWDAVILGGKQTFLPFAIFENLQHTYSWMKYYNNTLEQAEKTNEKTIMEILDEVQESIKQSLTRMEQVQL